MKVIPAIDLRDGAVVRLRQGDFAQTRQFQATALDQARSYRAAGADWLHAVDLDGARAGTPIQIEALSELASTGLNVQWGGGVRTREQVQQLLAAGAARVVVGSVAVRDPALFLDWLALFGGERLCLALDLRRSPSGDWRPAVDAWQGDSEAAIQPLLDRCADAGLVHALCTDIERDGMAQGPNLALYAWLVVRWPSLAWIASGGVRDAGDVAALADTGVRACVAGTALLDGSLPVAALAAGEGA